MHYFIPDSAETQKSGKVRIPGRGVALEGDLELPPEARSIVVFAHGSGSSRSSPRNQSVARTLRGKGFGTLLFDLLTAEEEALDRRTAHLRFDIALLGERLIDATRWILDATDLRGPAVGYFGASTGAGAALMAAAELGVAIGAVVSRGGRPDLAARALPRLKAPTLLIVGALDEQVIRLNEQALALLRSEKRLEIVPGASHLFEEPGTLAEVARLAGAWFERYLPAPSAHSRPGPPSR
jgi:putative phosphoribosyl transferase